jgi:heme-degrading monooxygenase HmoA
MSETMYAVKREGRKTAIRVFKSMEEATQLAEKEKGYVETRLGEPKRCTGNYCGVNQWCSQFADWTANQPSGASTPEA